MLTTGLEKIGRTGAVGTTSSEVLCLFRSVVSVYSVLRREKMKEGSFELYFLVIPGCNSCSWVTCAARLFFQWLPLLCVFV